MLTAGSEYWELKFKLHQTETRELWKLLELWIEVCLLLTVTSSNLLDIDTFPIPSFKLTLYGFLFAVKEKSFNVFFLFGSSSSSFFKCIALNPKVVIL